MHHIFYTFVIGKADKGGDADIDDLQERVTTNIVSHVSVFFLL